MTPAARLQAVVDLLQELEGTEQPVDRLLRAWFRKRRYAGSKDRTAISERLYAILRHRASLGWRLGRMDGRSLVMASLLAEGLSAGEVAALFDGSSYGPAAVTGEEAAGLERPAPGEPPLSVRGEFPDFLEPELTRAFREALLDEMVAQQQRASVDLRVNTLKASRDAVASKLIAEGFAAEPTPWSPVGLRLSSASGLAKLSALPLYADGAFEFQDEASQLGALLCGAAPGMRVLDYAAGAGGKSLALAARMQNRGEIVAHDISPERLRQLPARAARAGATIIRTSFPPPERGRAASVASRVGVSDVTPPRIASQFAPPLSGEGKYFDIVLVDSPCSGTGTWRRQPELRWRITPERLRELNALQDRLLDEAAVHVGPGGRLVYATCSVLPCENIDRIDRFLGSHPGFALLPAPWPADVRPPRIGDVFRASPLSTGTDGFFTAVLQRHR